MHSFAVVGVILAKPNYAHEWCVFPLNFKRMFKMQWDVLKNVFNLPDRFRGVCLFPSEFEG